MRVTLGLFRLAMGGLIQIHNELWDLSLMNDRQLEEFIDVHPLTSNSQASSQPINRMADDIRCMAGLRDISQGIARSCLGFVGNVSVRFTIPVYLTKWPQHVYDLDA